MIRTRWALFWVAVATLMSMVPSQAGVEEQLEEDRAAAASNAEEMLVMRQEHAEYLVAAPAYIEENDSLPLNCVFHPEVIPVNWVNEKRAAGHVVPARENATTTVHCGPTANSYSMNVEIGIQWWHKVNGIYRWDYIPGAIASCEPDSPDPVTNTAVSVCSVTYTNAPGGPYLDASHRAVATVWAPIFLPSRKPYQAFSPTYRVTKDVILDLF